MEVDPRFMEPEYPFEWGGIYYLVAGAYHLSLQVGPDPEMSVALFSVKNASPEVLEALTMDAVLRFSENGENYSPAATIAVSYPDLHNLQLHGQAANFVLSVEQPGLYALYTQHHPTEFQLELQAGTRKLDLATGGSDIVTVWDCAGKGPAGSKPIELEGHTALISAFGFAHRGLLIASASADGRLIFWQLGKQKRPLPLAQAAFDTSISQLVWSSDDRMLALGTESGLVSVCTTPRV